MKNVKKKCAIAANIRGMADGGPLTPGLLGFGAARSAASALVSHNRQVSSAVDSVSAPARAIAAPAGRGGLSGRGSGAMPPAHMLVAQRRGLADGGTIQSTGNAIKSRRQQLAEAEAEAFGQPAPKPAPEPEKKSAIRKLFGLKDGGMERGNADEIETGDGGPVKGPGGPTDDRVGPVALSNTEYVLPGDTVQAMGGPEALDQIRAATHKFVDPKNKPSIAKGLANGGYVVSEMPVEEISMGRSRADRVAIDKAVQSGKRAPGVVKNPTRTPALDRISAKMQATPAKPGMMKSVGGAATLAAVPMAVMQAAQTGGADIPDSAVQHPLEFIGTGVGQAYADHMPEFMGGLPKATVENNRTAGISAFDGTRFDVNQPAAAAQPAAAPTQPNNAAQKPVTQQGAAGTTGSTAVPSMPTIGKINVSRQPNGVMSFSGSGPVEGYEGAAAGQLKGGTVNTMPAAAMRSASPAASAELQAARAAAAARGDYQGAIDSITAEQGGFQKQQAGGNRIAMQLPQTFGEMMQFRAQMAMNRLNQRADESAMDNQNARLRIASDMAPRPESRLDAERRKGAEMENERGSITNSLMKEYLAATDDQTRNAVMTKMNALGGKSGDKFMTIDVEAGKDALGNPIYKKSLFNTSTQKLVDTGGAGGAQQDAGYPEGTKLTGPDGKAYVVKDGSPVLVQ